MPHPGARHSRAHAMAEATNANEGCDNEGLEASECRGGERRGVCCARESVGAGVCRECGVRRVEGKSDTAGAATSCGVLRRSSLVVPNIVAEGSYDSRPLGRTGAVYPTYRGTLWQRPNML